MPISEQWVCRLQETSTFGGMDVRAIRMLLEMGRPRRIASGEPVYTSGDHSNSIFVIVDGAIQVTLDHGEQQRRWRFEADQVFGDISLAAMRPRSCTAVAAEDSQLIEIDAGALHQLYERDARQYTMLTMNMGRNFSRLLLDERQG